MSDIVTLMETVATDQGLGFFHSFKSAQSFKTNKEINFPVLYLDIPKTLSSDLNAQGALEQEWNVFITVLDKGDNQNEGDQIETIMSAMRAKMEGVIQSLREEVDSHNRKVVKSMTGFGIVDIPNIFQGVCTGVATPMILTFVDPTFNCDP